MAQGKIRITFLPVRVQGDEYMTPEPKEVTLKFTRDDGIAWQDDWGTGFTSWLDIDEVKNV